MSFAYNLVLVLQVLSALGMIGLILVQHGKGADMGAAFGSGASGSLFGASGSANFLSRATAVLATVFFASTLALAYFGFAPRQASSSGSVLEQVVSTPAAQPASDSVAPAVAADAASAAASAGASAASEVAALQPGVVASGASVAASR